MSGTGCEYCHGRSVRALYLDKAEGCYAYVDGPRIDVCAYGAGMKVPINRCPMCGRELKKGEANDQNIR